MDLLCPLPLHPDDEPFRSRLHRDLVKELFRRSRAGLVPLLFLVVCMRFIARSVRVPVPGLDWVFAVLAALVAARLAWSIVVAGRAEAAGDERRRHRLFLVGSTATGLGFAALNILAFPSLDGYSLCLLCICEVGICSSAQVIMAPSLLALALYLGPILGSLVAMAALFPLAQHALAFLFALGLYSLVVAGVSLQVHRSVHDDLLQRLKLGELVLRDPLTGLRNRRYLHEFLDKEALRVRRSWHPESMARGNPCRNMGLIVLDLDHFKRVNDTHGHGAGDEVLRQMAELVRASIRKPDTVVRWGGEEFVVLALDVPRGLPLVAAERILAAVRGHEFRLASGQVLRLTCSIGYAHFPFITREPEELPWEQVLELADGAMYHAKQSGRDRLFAVVPGDVPAAQVAGALLQPGDGFGRAVDQGLVRLVE